MFFFLLLSGERLAAGALRDGGGFLVSPGLVLVPVIGPEANVAVGGDFRFDVAASKAGGLDGGELGFVLAAGFNGRSDCERTTMLVTFEAQDMMSA